MATSSSARKVAKLASRGKGKKVRFSGGTTFPAIVVAAVVSMIALVAYAKVTVPGEETGAPQPTDAWSIAYGIKICDEWLPSITGTADQLTEDASTGDLTAVVNGSDADGIIHYHAQAGGNTGSRATLGVFLDAYDIKLTDTKLELPASQVGEGETRSWNTKDFQCDGEDTVIKVRVWNDYTSGEFFDNVTDFRNLRFKNNGMVFAIAVVPNDADIAQPDSAAKLADLGVVGSGSAATTTTVGGSATSTTVAASGSSATSTTAASGTATTTTGG